MDIRQHRMAAIVRWCGLPWTGKRDYPYTSYSNISKKPISQKPSSTPYSFLNLTLNLSLTLNFHSLWWDWQSGVRLLLFIVALQNSVLSITLRSLELVLEDNSERNYTCYFNISFLRNNVTRDASDSWKSRYTILASAIWKMN